MSTGFIFRFEGDKLLQPFLIPQSLFTPQLQGDPAARELRRQQELEANHMLLENIEKARVSLDKAPEPGPLDAEFEKEPDFEPDEETLLDRLKRWRSKFFADKQVPEPTPEETLEAEEPLSEQAEQSSRPAHVRRRRTGVIHRYELLERLLSMSPQEYIDYLREHQKNIWMEESYPLGMLVFAALDLPWAELAQEAKALLDANRDAEMPINPDLFTTADWRHYVASTSSPAPPERELHTVAEGLAHPEKTLYCQVAALYNKVQDALQDYPAVQSLLKDYCTQAASDFYYQAVRKLNFIALSQEDQDIMRENKFVNVALRELNRAYALESASECIERYLDSWPEPDAVLVQYEDSDDREYSAAAYTILKFLWEQLKGLSDFQPGLSDLVDFTLVAADTQPDKDAMQRYGDALLLRYSGIRAGNKLYEQLRMKMLSRLSLPEESPKARKHPDITSRSYLVADNLSEAVMAEFLQMCGQHKTARHCKQCGMLFIPFSSTAKYCDRRSPNGGQRTCKEVGAEETAKNRTVDPATALYTKIGNKLNGRLSRFVGTSDASRKATITRWRAEVKPLVSQASEHPETFDPEAFDRELCAIFDRIRQEEHLAERLNQKESTSQKHRLKKEQL